MAGVTLDFSKAQPIQEEKPATSGVTLDFSKAQPVMPQPKIKVESSFTDKVLGELGRDDLSKGANRDDRPLRQRMADVPKASTGFEGQISDTGKQAAMTGAGVTAGLTLAGAGAAPKAVALWNAMPPYMKYAIGTYLLNQLDVGHKVKELGKLVGHMAGQ